MKLNRFFMLSVAGLALAACSNEDAVINPTDDGTSKTMIVSIAGISSGTTRANAPVDGWEADSNAGFANISKIALLFTNASGEVLYKWDIDKPGEEVSSGDQYDQWTALTGTNGVKFIGLNGVAQVHAVANLDVLEETANAGNGKVAVGENISELSVEFTQQGINAAATKGNAVYVASDLDINPLQQEPADATVTVPLPDAGEEGDFYYSAHLKLMPIISRIQINSIKVQSSGSVLFPEETVGSITADKFKLTWSNFKPTLYGVYLNNFYDGYSLLSATATDLLNNTSYMQDKIAGGAWNFGTPAEDYAADAAYVNYNSNAYQALVQYGANESGDPVLSPLELGEGKCIAFNVFVPFDITDPDTQNASSTNPKIHFQFDSSVNAGASNNYSTSVTLANNSPVTDDADLNYIASAETRLDYTLPTVQEGYLFANISKLYSEASAGVASSTELVMQPGKIYNMDVVISPVNMTVDLDNPETYNVVVTIEVVDFTAENIYPGLD